MAKSDAVGMFGDLDIESAADDPFAVPDNTYEAFLTEVKVGRTKDGSKLGMTLVYTISNGEHASKQVREWKNIPQPADPKNPDADESRALSFLKSRLLDLGIPSNRINSVQPDDLVGKEVTIAVVNRDGFVNVRKVTLVTDSEETPF